mmetsp:Transcript_7041/g.17119  ORF Transcript_7041/g.17119 Transcript_7041/m.17119 type:complete len:112 (+) Transcript_7041:327-662(+)
MWVGEGSYGPDCEEGKDCGVDVHGASFLGRAQEIQASEVTALSLIEQGGRSEGHDNELPHHAGGRTRRAGGRTRRHPAGRCTSPANTDIKSSSSTTARRRISATGPLKPSL